MTAATTATATTDQVGAVALADARFVALVTFRRTGAPVGTPVLFVLDGNRLLVRTAHDAGKLKRLRHTAGVLVVPSDQRGRWLGAPIAGRARILGQQAVGPTLARLHAKHRVAGPLFSALRRMRRQRDVIIEVTLEGAGA